MAPNQSGPKGQHGGKRAGAGHPGGSNALAKGERQAIKAASLRVPKDADPSHAELAGRALDVIVQVMDGGVHWQEAGPRLKAATHVRAEVCGPIAQKVEHAGKDGAPLSFVINMGEPTK